MLVEMQLSWTGDQVAAEFLSLVWDLCVEKPRSTFIVSQATKLPYLQVRAHLSANADSVTLRLRNPAFFYISMIIRSIL